MHKNWEYGKVKSPGSKFGIRFATLSPSSKHTNTLVFVNGRSEWIEKYDALWHKLKLSSLDATENSLNLSDIEVFGTSLEIIELAFNEMTQISLINPGLRFKFFV